MIYEHNQHQYERPMSRAGFTVPWNNPRMRRGKTCSIPMNILNHRHQEIQSSSSLDINTSKQMYDLVTWRMYDRITNARLRRRQMQEQQDQQQKEERQHQNFRKQQNQDCDRNDSMLNQGIQAKLTAHSVIEIQRSAHHDNFHGGNSKNSTPSLIIEEDEEDNASMNEIFFMDMDM